MHTLLRWSRPVAIGAVLLLIGGRLVAYVTPGEFLGDESGISASTSSSLYSSSSSALSHSAIATASSSDFDDNILIPTLVNPVASPETFVDPSLPLPSLIAPFSSSSKPSSSIVSSARISSAMNTVQINTNGMIGNDGYAGVRPVPRYPSLYKSSQIFSSSKSSQIFSSSKSSSSELFHPAAPAVIATATAVSSVPSGTKIASVIQQPPPSVQDPVRAPASSSTLHAGAASLPASGSPYAIALFLIMAAGAPVLWSVRRMEY